MKKRTILSLAAALLVSLNAGAFGLETVENAAEPTGAVTGTTLAGDIDIPLIDDKYGDLIWYSNFDTSADYKTATYVKEGSGVYAEATTTKSVSVVSDPTGSENKCLELVAGGAYSAVQVMTSSYAQPGTYTLVVDLFFPEGTATPGVLGRTEFLSGSDNWQSPWEAFANKAGEWQTYTWSVTANAAQKGLKEIGARRYANDATPYYYDNLRLYCNPTAGENQMVLLDGTSRQFITLDQDTYTFPEPADKTDFLAWYNSDTGAKYAAGAVASKADVTGKTFTAFHQNAEAPAMGFAFEGDTTHLGTEGASVAVITDENRTVLRYWQKPGSRWDGKTYKDDQRMFLIPQYCDVTAFNSREYNKVSYCYKIVKAVDSTKAAAPEELTPADLQDNATPWFAINYSPTNDYGGFFTPGGEHKIGRGNHTTTTGEYHVFTADMSLDSNSISGCKWNDYDTMYGFVIQPCASNYEAITYVDYIRVYRSGITTVTYDSNAAEYEELGYTVQYDVPAETGRGLGSGYLLTGDKPILEGHTFVGWALKPDATPADVVTSIKLTGDTTVYAVWVEEGTFVPRTINKNSLRTGTVSGIRFASTIDLSVKAGLSAAFEGVEPDEYGFIVSRKVLLDGETLTFGTAPNEKGVGVTPNGATYVSGVAFDKAKGINRVYDNDGSKFSEVTAGKNEAFTAILTGIPEENYGDTLVARPYIKIGGLYFYGRAREMSMKSVAEDLKTNYDSLTDAEKELVDRILAATGA